MRPGMREAYEEEREAWSRGVRNMQMGTKQLKKELCDNITAVSSLFQIWDIDGDGVITSEEFSKAVVALGVPVPTEVSEAVFAEFDHDGSGTISSGEFLRFALRDRLAGSAARVMDFFKNVDADGSGEIAADEFRKAVQSLGFEIPREHLDAIFNSMDSDGSGSLSFKELHRQLRQGASVKLSKRLRVGGAGHVRVSAKERLTHAEHNPVYAPTTGDRRLATQGKIRPTTAPVPPPSQPGAAVKPPPTAQASLAAPHGLMEPFMPALTLAPATLRPQSWLTEGGANGEIALGRSVQRDSQGLLTSTDRLVRPGPGGGGGPRSPEGRFVGFAKPGHGVVICDEKRRRTIQDEKIQIAAERLRGAELLYPRKTAPGYRGPRWAEPLPALDPVTKFPYMNIANATRYVTGSPTPRSQHF